MKNRWYFVINPISGNGKGLETWEEIKILLEESNIEFDFNISEYHKHTIKLISDKHTSGYRKFIGIGGDGTINEVINGVFLSENNDDLSTISLIPVGTGNDWVKNHNAPLSANNIISKITNNQTYPHDVGVIDTPNITTNHFFINVAGAGIDGCVVSELEKSTAKGEKGKLAYIRSLITALLHYKSPEATLSVNNQKVYTGETLVVAAAKGQYFGSGMHISPLSVPDNGTLDITLVKNDSKWVIFTQIHKLFTGAIADVSFVEKMIGKHLELHSNHPMPIQADGEFVDESDCFSISLIKHGVLVLL